MDVTSSARFWIERLGLQRHPEGGWFRETYRSGEMIGREALPVRFTGERPCATSIYFLIESSDFSAFHRIRSDEIWHFHAGAPLTVHVLDENGYRALRIGVSMSGECRPQGVVSAGSWFAATVDAPGSFSLVGCTVAPGFDFQDFEIATFGELALAFPEHLELIRRLTRS